jgi:hypothetical protein
MVKRIYLLTRLTVTPVIVLSDPTHEETPRLPSLAGSILHRYAGNGEWFAFLSKALK